MEEVPIVEASESIELKVEQLNETNPSPCLNSSGPVNSAVSTSGPNNTVDTFSGAPPATVLHSKNLFHFPTTLLGLSTGNNKILYKSNIRDKNSSLP